MNHIYRSDDFVNVLKMIAGPIIAGRDHSEKRRFGIRRKVTRSEFDSERPVCVVRVTLPRSTARSLGIM